jgi:hypothetical protein
MSRDRSRSPFQNQRDVDTIQDNEIPIDRENPTDSATVSNAAPCAPTIYADITVETLAGNQFIMAGVDLYVTVGELKTKIQEQEGIPTDEQQLVFNGEVLKKHSSRLCGYVVSDCVFTLVRTRVFSLDVQITFKSSGDERDISLSVEGTDTIDVVKAKIHDQEGISSRPFHFFALRDFGQSSVRLEDGGRTLSEYGITSADFQLYYYVD